MTNIILAFSQALHRVVLSPTGIQGPPGGGGAGGVSDGDKGGIIVSGSGAVWTVKPASITNLMLGTSAIALFATAAQGAKADGALQPGALIPWTDVTGKPTLFSGAYGDLSGIPATFAPSTHTHPASAITDFAAAVALVPEVAVAVSSDPTGIAGADAVLNIVSLTTAEYAAIGVPGAATLYVITDA